MTRLECYESFDDYLIANYCKVHR